MRIHLDTDIGGDTDDACALALLLGSPEAELVGVSTVHDPIGRRAGYAHQLLEMAGRLDVPVAVGTAPSLTTGTIPGGFPDEQRYWGRLVQPRAAGDAVELLKASAEIGATIVAIGPCTNLALAGSALRHSPVVLMGGWSGYPDAGLPQWGPDMDWNVTCDPEAARAVAAIAGELTLAPLAVTMRAQLRERHLPRLRAAGALGELLARQAVEHAQDHQQRGDLLNFQYDSVACLTALGWPGITVENTSLASIADIDGDRSIRSVSDIDAGRFSDTWLSAIQRLAA